MLFKRFLFVLYLLSQYGLFLLGSFYQTPLRLLPLCSIILSMVSIIVITFFQLQRLAKQNIIDSPTQWSTIVWSFVHIFICLNFLLLSDLYTLIIIFFADLSSSKFETIGNIILKEPK